MDPLNLVILGGLAAVSGTVLYFMLRSAASQAVNATVRLEPASPRIGETVQVAIRVNPTADVQVDHIDLTLECRRREYRGEYGQSETTEMFLDLFDTRARRYRRSSGRVEYDTVCRGEWRVDVGRRLRAGHPEIFQAEIQVSSDGLPTDREGNLTIGWGLSVRFAIPRFPDAVLGQEVVVRSRY